MKKNISAMVVAALCAFSASAAFAETASSVTISASIANECSVSTQELPFGNYDRTNGTTGSTDLTVQCTRGTSALVALDMGINGSGFRQMRNDVSSDLMNYELYSDAARQEVWNQAGVSYTGTGNPETLTIYGAIPAGQNLNIGTYMDTVTATINFTPDFPS